MGTLLGHALPGSFFLLFSLWRIVQIPRRVQLLQHCRERLDDVTKDVKNVHSKRHRLRRSNDGETKEINHPLVSSHKTARENETTEPADAVHGTSSLETFYTSSTYPCCFGMCARWPLEGIAKIVASGVGMAGELWASTDYGRAGRITSIGDIQHVTMYSFFLISGIIDVLRWKGVAWIVPGLDFIALSQAFFGEWLMFSHHIHGRAELDMLLHYLLLIIIGCTVISILIEYKYSHSLHAALVTTYLMFLQGTWFIQVGLILYPPPGWFQWQIKEDERLMVATMIFAWHIIADFVFLIIAYSFISWMFYRFCRPSKWEVWDNVLAESCVREVELSREHKFNNSATAECTQTSKDNNTQIKEDNLTMYHVVSLSDEEEF